MDDNEIKPTGFEPNFEEKKFSITIDVKENSIGYCIEKVGGKEFSFFDVIGALEYVKMLYSFNQSMYNKKKLIEQREKELEAKEQNTGHE